MRMGTRGAGAVGLSLQIRELPLGFWFGLFLMELGVVKYR